MKLAYKTPPVTMAGSAVPGCGTIHVSEIEPTLTQLSDDLEFPFDLNDYTVGSAGKREYSGDLDIVLDDRWWGRGVAALRENLEELYDKKSISGHGNMLHLKYPIISYKEELQEVKPRTGYVQIDFLFGNYDWLKFYHYSDGKSEYKGAHRNLMIAAICSVINVKQYYGNTTTVECRALYDDLGFLGLEGMDYFRYKWGPHGFARINRKRVRTKSGDIAKKPEDTVIAGPFFDAGTIIEILFPGCRDLHTLDSMETIMKAVKENYGMVEQERVWRQAASNFYDWPDGRNFYYPEEISKYFPTKDK